MRRAKDLEEIKSFLTIQVDKYRKPYAHYDIQLPRRCIFIGTTNNYAFLTDQTGNRRFFPVIVHSKAQKIYESYETIEYYIKQAWAEAVYNYKNGTLPKDYDHSIDDELDQIRKDFEEDDWRISAIDKYLADKRPGENVCCLELWTDACHLDEDKLTNAESRKIGAHLENHTEWKRFGKARFTIRGRTTQQRAWVKVKPFPF